MSKRPTPETDARWMYPASFDSNEKVVQISVAQKLERERDEARDALIRAEDLLADIYAQDDMPSPPWLREVIAQLKTPNKEISE